MVKNNLVVAVDVDDVTLDLMTSWLNLYNSIYLPYFPEEHLKPSDIKEWDICKYVNEDCGKKIYDLLGYNTLYAKALPVVGAMDGIYAIQKMGHRIVFATSTVRVAAGRKLDWLVDHGFLTLKYGSVSPDYIEVSDKSLVYADVLVDDRPDNLHTFRGEHKLLFDRPWNRSNKDYPRVMDWEDVVTYMKTGATNGEY